MDPVRGARGALLPQPFVGGASPDGRRSVCVDDVLFTRARCSAHPHAYKTFHDLSELSIAAGLCGFAWFVFRYFTDPATSIVLNYNTDAAPSIPMEYSLSCAISSSTSGRDPSRRGWMNRTGARLNYSVFYSWHFL